MLQMTEKDRQTHLNRQSKQKLNQTRVSSNFMDNSYQGSIILNNNLSNKNIIPLHSHYIYKNINTNHNVKSISSLENSLSPPFRLLHPNSESPKSNSQSQSFVIGARKKKGFGSSQQRKLAIFEGLKEIQPNLNPDQKCIHNMGIITQHKIKESIQTKNMNKTTQLGIDYKRSPETIFGFGSGEKLERIQQRIYKKGCPGPGQYEIGVASIGNTIKYKKLAHQILNMKNRQNSQQETKKLQVRQSYCYEKQMTERQQNLIKLRRKEKISEKKEKIKNLMQKMKLRQIETKVRYQKQKFEKCSQKINRYSENRFQYFSKKNQQNKLDKKIPSKCNQLTRVQLREKTINFLPKVDDMIVPFKQSQFRQPTYKYMFSNSFVSKNDHAFQAHFYKPKQKQGEYIFLQAKKQFKKTQDLSPFFKSKSTRIAF